MTHTYDIEPSVIRKIDSIETLEVMLDSLDLAISHIEESLNFASDDQTDDWERRAIAALAYKKVQRTIAARRLKKLREPEERDANKIASQFLHEKIAAMKADDKREAREIQIETQRLAVERERVKQARFMREDYYYVLAAKRFLTPEQRLDCEAYARSMTRHENEVAA